MQANKQRYVVSSFGPNDGFALILDTKKNKYCFGFESTTLNARYICRELNELNDEIDSLQRKLRRHHE